MHPVLFHLFGYPVGSYGFLMTVSHLLGSAALLYLARKNNIPISAIVDVIFAVLIFGIIGARLGYAFNQWDDFKQDPWSLTGLSFYGGFPFAFVAFLLVMRWRKLPILATADLVCPVLPFSLGLIRIGCFAQGCCYGAPTSVPWAVSFHLLESKVPPALFHRSLHPSQLYEATFLLCLAPLLVLLGRKNKMPPGFLATFSIFSYALYRFFADSYRGDLARGFWGVSWMSPTQGAATLGILATPIVLFICLRARNA